MVILLWFEKEICKMDLNIKWVVFILLVSILLASWINSSNQENTNIDENENNDSHRDAQCNGSVTGKLVKENGEVVRVELNGRGPAKSAVVTEFGSALDFASLARRELYAGENGITVIDDGHYILLFPGGYANLKVMYFFNYSDNSTNAVNVHCQPITVAYRPGQHRVDDSIVGHCKINTTLMSVPYFKLRFSIQNGKWKDSDSAEYLFSQLVATTDLTYPVILQYENDYDAYVRKLYFANGNTLHKIDLGDEQATMGTYTCHLLNEDDQIHHLVPVVNSSFSGLRIIFSTSNDSGYCHQYFSPELGIIGTPFRTDYVAFDSYNLSYLVTFINLKTLSIMKHDRTSKQFPLGHNLDDPIHCRNMATQPNTHHLICLAGNGLHPLIINITSEQVTSRIIPAFNLRIVRVGILTGHTFYLLTEEAEMLFYVVNSAVVCVGRYALRDGTDYVIVNATSDIQCSHVNSEPNDIGTARNGLDLGTILAIVFVVMLLLLLYILLPFGIQICNCIRNYRALTTVANKEPSNIQVTSDDYEDEAKENASDEENALDDASKTLSLMSAGNSRASISTGSVVLEQSMSIDRTNEERFVHNKPEPNASEGNTETAMPYIRQPDPCIPFVSSPKQDHGEVFKCHSTQPVPFVEADSVKDPVQVKSQPSQPVPAVLRHSKK